MMNERRAPSKQLRAGHTMATRVGSLFRVVSAWGLLGLLVLLCAACEPPDPPQLENPPCLTKEAPGQGGTISREAAQFTLDFSKALEPSTISEETIYLVRDEMDISFLRNLESSSPVTESRLPRLVPLAIETKDNGGTTQVVVKPKITLRGDTVYQLVLTRKLRDKLEELTENRRTGSRPLNRCADNQQVWTGSVDEYKDGFSVVLTYRTEVEPQRPGTPRIVEVMATPPPGKGEYVEIQNIHPTESLDLCGLFLNDGSTAREIAPLSGTKCDLIGPGKFAVLIVPNYDRNSNPYGIPADAVLLTTKGSTTTLLSGGLSSGETIQLLQGEDLLEQVSPTAAKSGTWPPGKSLERCDPNGPNDTSNWADSSDASGGTPGRANSAKCQ